MWPAALRLAFFHRPAPRGGKLVIEAQKGHGWFGGLYPRFGPLRAVTHRQPKAIFEEALRKPGAQRGLKQAKISLERENRARPPGWLDGSEGLRELCICCMSMVCTRSSGGIYYVLGMERL